MRRIPVILTCVLLFSIALAGHPRAARYSIVELPMLPGGAFAEAMNVNDRNQIVGWGGTETGGAHAILWQDGQAIDLGTLGGASSRAWGINNRGDVVGESETATGEDHAFLWRDGEMFDLAAAGPFSRAFAINHHGDVAGEAQLRAVLLRRGTRIDLPGMTSARDLNLHRVVTGLGPSGNQFHALIWKRGELIDLGTLPGGDFGAGRSINDRAQVVGESTVESTTHGFIWEDGVMVPLQDLVPGFATFARDINNRGQIVGSSVSNPNVVGGDSHAVLWNDRHDTPTDLGTLPGDPLSSAAAINDRNLIVGFSGAGGFNAHAVAWVPDR